MRLARIFGAKRGRDGSMNRPPNGATPPVADALTADAPTADAPAKGGPAARPYQKTRMIACPRQA